MAFVGTKLTFSVLFTNSSSLAADPTTVRFRLTEGVDGTELDWIFNASPVEGTHYPTGANPIVKDSTGNYHVAWISRKPERHTGYWRGLGNDVDQSQQSTAFVQHSDVASVEVY